MYRVYDEEESLAGSGMLYHWDVSSRNKGVLARGLRLRRLAGVAAVTGALGSRRWGTRRREHRFALGRPPQIAMSGALRARGRSAYCPPASPSQVSDREARPRHRRARRTLLALVARRPRAGNRSALRLARGLSALESCHSSAEALGDEVVHGAGKVPGVARVHHGE